MKRPILALAFAAACAAAVPTPESHFGHQMGADKKLLDWEKVVSYFKALEKSSDRIRVVELGKSTEGRPFIAATIASPQTLRDLPRFIENQRRLGDPRITTEADAAKIIPVHKTVVLITCSIHATEVASTHTAVEFAWRMLTEDKPRYRAILDNVVFLLVPSLNPDGVDIVTEWYRKTLGTKWEGSAPPRLYQKYVGHDNNRDWYIFSQAETRHTISKLHNVWHPQIVYDVHQQGATSSRMFVPPWMDPIEPNVDPILSQEMNLVGMGIATDLTAAGKTGVSVHSSYDFWTPARHYQSFHGGLRILTESASARLATPVEIKREQLDETALGYNAQARSWNHLEPWAGGTWRVRDIVDYQLIAFESVLYQAAIHREDMLRNFYRVGQKAAARTAPAAFVIPARQRDPGAARKLLETLQFGQVEIERAPNGDHVIRMQQPYSSWAKALLERQQYPDLRLYPGGPPKRPYDVTAHTLPLLMGVDVRAVDAAPAGRLERVKIPEQPALDSLSGSDTDAWRAVNAIWKKGGQVWRNPATGDFSASARDGFKPFPRPRIALHQSWVPSMDEGWTRWLFDEFGFEYTRLLDAEIRAGDLRKKYDAIVFPDESPAAIREGSRSLPPDYAGGVGADGAAALKRFAEQGGTLIFLNRSTEYALETLEIAAKNAVKGVSSRDFYSPGSLLNVEMEPGSPLALGLPREFTVWSEHSPAWEAPSGVAARYPSQNLLASGWLLGEKYIAGRAALLDVAIGSGRAILFGMRPQYRAQSYLTFKLLFNALAYPPR